MDVEVLISTMNINTEEENKKLLKKMNINGKSLTISQTNEQKEENKTTSKNKIIYDKGKGLSRSRNIAIQNSSEEIILIADDDVVYDENYEETIKQAYIENPNADMIAFYVYSENPKRKTRKLKTGKIGWIRIFRVASFQLTFKAKAIKANNLKFDENFGSGTNLFCGEETIFLGDCLRKNMKLLYIDKTIGIVKQTESMWYKGITKEYVKVEKEVFKRIAPKVWPILWIQFLVRKVLPNILKW